MTRLLLGLCLVLVLTSPAWALGDQKAAVLARFGSDRTVVLGMHDTIGGFTNGGFLTMTDRCHRRPDLFSSDFGFASYPEDGISSRPALSAEILDFQNQGVLVTLSWHACNPIVGEPCTFAPPGVTTPLSAGEWTDILIDGTATNILWKAQADLLATYLQTWEDAGIVVLLRPYHEMNLGEFWWASTDPAQSKALWIQLYNYYTTTKGLSNLLWVWSVSYHPTHFSTLAQFYPGDAYVDIVGLDIYPQSGNDTPPWSTGWDGLQLVTATKPIALSEVSHLPTPAELALHHWAYVVPFGNTVLVRDNTDQTICQVYRQDACP